MSLVRIDKVHEGELHGLVVDRVNLAVDDAETERVEMHHKVCDRKRRDSRRGIHDDRVERSTRVVEILRVEVELLRVHLEQQLKRHRPARRVDTPRREHIPLKAFDVHLKKIDVRRSDQIAQRVVQSHKERRRRGLLARAEAELVVRVPRVNRMSIDRAVKRVHRAARPLDDVGLELEVAARAERNHGAWRTEGLERADPLGTVTGAADKLNVSTRALDVNLRRVVNLFLLRRRPFRGNVSLLARIMTQSRPERLQPPIAEHLEILGIRARRS
eukprot:Amastigsp_a677010_243.p2 type:complete len:273 gc:universal Amastigsp_a677010_243:92-910(+)